MTTKTADLADRNGMPLRRYQVQTRSGLTWGHIAMSDDLSVADKARRAASRTGYTARIVDTIANEVVS